MLSIQKVFLSALILNPPSSVVESEVSPQAYLSKIKCYIRNMEKRRSTLGNNKSDRTVADLFEWEFL